MKFVVPGEPCGKGRPRVVRVGGISRTYTPEKTAQYEAKVQWMFREQCHEFIADGPVGMRINAFFSVPKSASRRKRELMLVGMIRPTKAPDVDNLAKCIGDACNGVAYRDDAQIVRLLVDKRYAEQPRVEVEIWSIQGGEKA